MRTTMERLYSGLDMVTFRELLRVSKDDSGVERSNEEQHADHVEALERQPRWRLSDRPAYSEVGSASEFRTGAPRVDFPQLLADIAGGTFGADVLLMWEASRGSRRVDEWLALITLCASRGVLICAHSKGMRFYDPEEPEDRAALLRDAIDAELEAAKTSKRVRRAMEANARAGKLNGGRRAYGYTPDGMSVVEEEAEIVRECARRVLAGDSVRSIAADLNRRGVKSATGKAWHPGPLRNMLAGNRIAAIRTHHGRVTAKGTWPAIVDEPTHRRLVAVLASRPRMGERGKTPWLLTGILRCGWCGAALVGNRDSDSAARRYMCRKAPGYHGCGRLVIKADPVEELLGDIVVERLADIQARRAAVPVEDDVEERRELEAIAARRVEVSEDYAIDGDRAAKNEAMAALRRREEEVEARLAAKVREVTPLAFVMTEGLAGKTWAETPTEERRRVLRALIDHVAVGPATVRGSTRFEASRVTTGITWKA